MQWHDLPVWDPVEHGFDAVTISNQSRILNEGHVRLVSRLRHAIGKHTRLRRLFQWIFQSPIHVYPYIEALPLFVHLEPQGFEYYPCVVPNWDNTARSGLDGLVLHDSRPDLFRDQVRQAVERVQSLSPERRMIFVKSWNEWAEGNYLEPDLKHGKAYLEALKAEILASDSVPALARVEASRTPVVPAR